MYEDKTLVCRDCGQEFVFTAGEQEFYAEKGFQNEPTRCKACRQARKASRPAPGAPRETYTTTCANCGAETTVPFIPKNDRPIYCSECFAPRKRWAGYKMSAMRKAAKAVFRFSVATSTVGHGIMPFFRARAPAFALKSLTDSPPCAIIF